MESIMKGSAMNTVDRVEGTCGGVRFIATDNSQWLSIWYYDQQGAKIIPPHKIVKEIDLLVHRAFGYWDEDEEPIQIGYRHGITSV